MYSISSASDVWAVRACDNHQRCPDCLAGEIGNCVVVVSDSEEIKLAAADPRRIAQRDDGTQIAKPMRRRITSKTKAGFKANDMFNDNKKKGKPRAGKRKKLETCIAEIPTPVRVVQQRRRGGECYILNAKRKYVVGSSGRASRTYLEDIQSIADEINAGVLRTPAGCKAKLGK